MFAFLLAQINKLKAKPEIITGAFTTPVTVETGTQVVSFSAPQNMPKKNAKFIALISSYDNVYCQWNPQSGWSLTNNSTWNFNVLNNRNGSVNISFNYIVLY